MALRKVYIVVEEDNMFCKKFPKKKKGTNLDIANFIKYLIYPTYSTELSFDWSSPTVTNKSNYWTVVTSSTATNVSATNGQQLVLNFNDIGANRDKR